MTWQQLILSLEEAVSIPVKLFFSSHQRVFVPYLITSALMAYWVYRQARFRYGFLRYLFPAKLWWSRSAKVDYLVVIVNGFVKAIGIAPLLFIGVFLQHVVQQQLVVVFGPLDYDFSATSIIISYTIVLWLTEDFFSFFVHWLMHRVQWLWEFHKVHHSATVLTPLTQYRIHPVELLLNNVKSLVVYGVVTGVFFYLAEGKVGTITFIGVNVLTFVFLAIGANLRHSHVKFTFPSWVERWVISPFQHQIHHSDASQHFNKNLGSHLAIWDWLFGTLLLSKEVRRVRFGLGKRENEDFAQGFKSLWMPFVKLFRPKK